MDDDAGTGPAGFAARYRGRLDPRDAIRWAGDPLAPAADGTPSPGRLLEERRRDLYRGTADAAAVRAFETAVAEWDRELALAREAMRPEAEPTGAPASARRPSTPRRRLAALALVGGVLTVAVSALVLGAHRASAPVAAPTIGPDIAAGVPGVIVARASAEHGPRSGSGLNGAGHFVTIVVTCLGRGGIEVRLSDGTDGRFACTATFPRTVTQPSADRLGGFGYVVTVTGTPDWAMTLSR